MKHAFEKSTALMLLAALTACGGGGGGTAVDPGAVQSQTVTAASYLGVAAGGGHTVAIKSDGSLLAWGLNRGGQLGDGTLLSKVAPTPVVFSTTVAVTNVSAGQFHTAALECKTAGCTLWTWGSNDSGRLGDGTFTDKKSPVKITGTTWLSVSAGGSHTAAVKKDGTLWTWGNNFLGQLGDATNLSKAVPTAPALPLTVTSAPGAAVTASTVAKPFWGNVAVGGAHTLAILTGAVTNSSGPMYRWGSNTRGQLGLTTRNSQNTPGMLPPLVAPGNSAGSETYKYKAVAAGGDHSLAIRDNGELYSFGGNGFGQLGNGTVDDGLWVVQVGTDFDWESISAGGGINPVGADDAALNGGHSLAIKTDGTLWAWGSNYYGQLGLGTTDDATTPMQVGKERGWVRVSAGKLHSFAWKADGSLWGWGNNAEGQLGNGTSGTTAKNILVPTRLN